MPSRSKCWKYYQEDFEKLFGVNRRTLKKWEKDKILDRTSLKKVVLLYIRMKFSRLDVLKIWEKLK